jgi:hypothetical protein
LWSIPVPEKYRSLPMPRYLHSSLQLWSIYGWHSGATIDDVIYILLSLKEFSICISKRKLRWKFCRNRFIAEVLILGKVWFTNKCFIHRPAIDSDMGKDIDRDSYGFKF